MNKSRLIATLCACALSFSANATLVTEGSAPGSSEFSYFPTPTAWDPGADTARIEGFPAPGGATWSLMGAGLVDASTFDAHSGAPTTAMTALPGLAGITVPEIEATIDKALDVWAGASDFTNLGQVVDSGAGFGATDAAGGNIGDIRVGAVFIDGSFGVLAHAFQPGNDNIFGAGGNIAGDAHFDNDETWFISDLDGGVFGTGDFDLLTVMIHEFGHSLGLGHSDIVGSIMEAVYAGTRTALHADDIAGIQSIYGGSTSPVPVPAAVWLFGSGLLGLIGIARRKKV